MLERTIYEDGEPISFYDSKFGTQEGIVVSSIHGKGWSVYRVLSSGRLFIVDFSVKVREVTENDEVSS